MNIQSEALLFMILVFFLNKTVPAGSGVGVASFDMGTRIDVDKGAPGGGMAVTGTGNMVGSL